MAERQQEQSTQGDPFAALLSNFTNQQFNRGTSQTSTINPAAQQALINVLAQQQQMAAGGNQQLQDAVVNQAMRVAQGQRAAVESRSRAAGGYNSAATRLAKDRVDAEAANKAAAQVSQFNQAERANAAGTAANLGKLTQSTRAEQLSNINKVSDIGKLLAAAAGVKALPGVFAAGEQLAGALTAESTDPAEVTINGVTYDNPNAGFSKVAGPLGAIGTALAATTGPVGAVVGGLVNKYAPGVVGKLTNTNYATAAQWEALKKANPAAFGIATPATEAAAPAIDFAGAVPGVSFGASSFAPSSAALGFGPMDAGMAALNSAFGSEPVSAEAFSGDLAGFGDTSSFGLGGSPANESIDLGGLDFGANTSTGLSGATDFGGFDGGTSDTNDFSGDTDTGFSF